MYAVCPSKRERIHFSPRNDCKFAVLRCNDLDVTPHPPAPPVQNWFCVPSVLRANINHRTFEFKMVRVRQWKVTSTRCTCVYIWHGRHWIERKWFLFGEKLFTYPIIHLKVSLAFGMSIWNVKPDTVFILESWDFCCPFTIWCEERPILLLLLLL